MKGAAATARGSNNLLTERVATEVKRRSRCVPLGLVLGVSEGRTGGDHKAEQINGARRRSAD